MDTLGAERHSYGAGFASFRIRLLFAIPATHQPTRAGQQSHQQHCLAAGQDLPLSVPFDQHAAFDPARAGALPSKGGEAGVRRIWSCFRSCAQPWASRSLPAYRPALRLTPALLSSGGFIRALTCVGSLVSDKPRAQLQLFAQQSY